MLRVFCLLRNKKPQLSVWFLAFETANENTNGLLRFYFPKKMSFAHLTQEMLDVAVKQLNTRPRKRLGYKTPEQVFRAKW
jgi:IS30 family transposase